MDEARAQDIITQIDLLDDVKELRRVRIYAHNKEKKIKGITKEMINFPKFSMFDKNVAAAMDAMMTHNFPDMKPRTEKDLENWAEDIRKIREIDGFDESTIMKTAQFALKDSFWKKNILSGAKLRKQMNTLIAQAAAPDRSLI